MYRLILKVFNHRGTESTAVFDCWVAGLKNVKAEAIRAEDIRKKRYDFVLARAVTRLDKLVMWMRRVIKREHRHPVPNGLLTLKGGQIEGEFADLQKGEYHEVHHLSALYEEEMFKEKYIVYVQG